MKTIGLIGGMSWESTASYYKIVNTRIKEELGGLSSAKCMLYSLNFQEVADMQKKGQWAEAGQLLANAAKSLQNGGCDFVMICTNTMHKVADDVQKAIDIPLVHIAEVTGHELQKKGVKKAALLGTRYTMEQDFYRTHLTNMGIETITPNEADRIFINDVIFGELCVGIITDASRTRMESIISDLANKGATGVVLGCTEIGMLIDQEHSCLPVFDTTIIHAEAAVAMALGKYNYTKINMA